MLGGYLFGQWVGLLYSTIGLALGSVTAFAVGRWLGARYVQKLVSPHIWRKMGFIVEAEGAILCFIIFLIPGLPKDMACYLFGLSPMPFWIFGVVSDRKSTRLNSSHGYISYAVFCLKKKKKS